MCIYGIELLEDNIAECNANLLELFADYLGIEREDETYLAGAYVVSQNIVHGDALSMLNAAGKPITFAEWGYLGKGKFQRRDFRFSNLAQSSKFNAEDSLFSQLGDHEIFSPFESYPPMTLSELAVIQLKDDQ